MIKEEDINLLEIANNQHLRNIANIFIEARDYSQISATMRLEEIVSFHPGRFHSYFAIPGGRKVIWMRVCELLDAITKSNPNLACSKEDLDWFFEVMQPPAQGLIVVSMLIAYITASELTSVV